MPKTMIYTGELVITSCWCGIQLAIPSALYRKMQSDSEQGCYCPVGHSFIYSKNAADREKERADAAEKRAHWLAVALDAQRDQTGAAERSARAYRGHLTRLRNRIADGVCPVTGCRRNFANVRSHIENQHPEWAHEHPEAMK